MKSKIIAIALASMMVCGIAACGKSAQEPVNETSTSTSTSVSVDVDSESAEPEVGSGSIDENIDPDIDEVVEYSGTELAE